MGSGLREGAGVLQRSGDKGLPPGQPEACLTDGDDVSGNNLIAGDGPPLPAAIDLGRGEAQLALGLTAGTMQAQPWS